MESDFWKAKPKLGRPLLYTDPEKLKSDCEEYFAYTKQRTDWNKQLWVG